MEWVRGIQTYGWMFLSLNSRINLENTPELNTSNTH